MVPMRMCMHLSVCRTAFTKYVCTHTHFSRPVRVRNGKRCEGPDRPDFSAGRLLPYTHLAKGIQYFNS